MEDIILEVDGSRFTSSRTIFARSRWHFNDMEWGYALNQSSKLDSGTCSSNIYEKYTEYAQKSEDVLNEETPRIES